MKIPMKAYLAEVDAAFRARPDIMDEDARSLPIPLAEAIDGTRAFACFTFRVTGRPPRPPKLWPARSTFVVTYPDARITRLAPWPTPTTSLEPIAELGKDDKLSVSAYREHLAALLDVCDRVVPAFWRGVPPSAGHLRAAKAAYLRHFEVVIHAPQRLYYEALEPSFFAWLMR